MNLMDRIDEEESPIPSLGYMETKILKPNSSSYLSFGKMTNLNDQTMSDDDDEGEASFMEDGSNETFGRVKGRKGTSSQWQRMRWTDSRVRLLIEVVACVDDDGDGGGNGSGRRSSSSGCLQKKGKWKTVSKVMGSKGCEVSPQQCEDKFNDLNKRYKRLNDILGRGVSCRVVENASLMDSMPRLSAKMKEDVKKILSSKHLFYAEMYAYHNGQKIPKVNANSNANATHCSDEVEENDESGDDDDDDDDMDHEDDDGEGEGEKGLNNGFRHEMNEFFEDPNNSKTQKKEWVMNRVLQIHEQRVRIETEAFEMEKKRFKWQRFCDRKDRELEISRLENERLMLENERMTLQVKRKDHVTDSD